MKASLLFTLLLIASTASFAQQSNFHLLKTFHIQSPGGWDYLAVGPGNNRLYVSHGTQVNILDQTTGDSLGIIENTSGVHGIAFDLSQNKGFTSNGRLNAVTVFNLETNAVITQVPAGQNPDAILYDPFSKLIITCNGRSNNISLIDPVNNKLLDSVQLEGKPETAVSDGEGVIYINIEDKNEIARVDIATRKLVGYWPLDPAEEPTGLVLDKKTGRLFAGCGNKKLAVVDVHSGKLLQALTIGDGCDGVGFDESTGLVFTSNGEGTMSIFKENSSGELTPVATVNTKKGARTIAVDSKLHLVYLPTADFDPTALNAQGRPKMIPGTFGVLVMGD